MPSQRVTGATAMRDRRPRAALRPSQEGNDREYQEYEEQDLSNAGRAGGKTAEAQDRRHDGDYEKYDCVVKHFYISRRWRSVRWRCACIFRSTHLSRYRKPPRFCVRRV